MTPNHAERAAGDLALKLRLERRVKPALTRWFKSVSRDIRLSWAVHRALPDFNHQLKSLEAILLDHYKLVSKYFASRTAIHLTKKYSASFEFKKTDEERQRDDVIAMTLFLYAKMRAEEQSRIILATTQASAQNIAARVVARGAAAQAVRPASPAENPGLPTNTEVPVQTPAEEANAIKKDFDEITPVRVDAIAATETQAMAEKSKLVEAGSLATAMANGESPVSGMTAENEDGSTKKLMKTWRAILDSATREHHVEADGQTIPINKYFDVGGEALSYPGDTTYATAKNIVNCRCSAVYDAE